MSLFRRRQPGRSHDQDRSRRICANGSSLETRSALRRFAFISAVVLSGLKLGNSPLLVY